MEHDFEGLAEIRAKMRRFSRTPDWNDFNSKLRKSGPKMLANLPPEIRDLVEMEAQHTDAYLSEEMRQRLNYYWIKDVRTAALVAAQTWVGNVKSRLRDVLGPSSALPDIMKWSAEKRADLLANCEKIEFQPHEFYLMELVVAGVAIEEEVEAHPNVLLQAVVQAVEKRQEGLLIQALTIPWRSLIAHLQRDWSEAYKLTPRQWEEMVAAAFDQAKFDEVILTPRSGDHGRDVIAVRRGVGTIKIIGSVKAYKPGNLIRYDDVRALAGVLLGDPSASKGIVVTTSDFAPGIIKDPFIAPLLPTRLELMNGDALKAWLTDLTKR